MSDLKRPARLAGAASLVLLGASIAQAGDSEAGPARTPAGDTQSNSASTPTPNTQPSPNAAPGGPATAPAAPAMPPTPKEKGVYVTSDPGGLRLQVDGRDFLVVGVNWDYVPIGQNYRYDIWSQPDDFIREALEREMSLLRRMGVNAIRVYQGIPARWIAYIYEHYGIYTVLNDTVGRYGLDLNGVYTASLDYSDPEVRAALKSAALKMVDEFRHTPGLLMWLLGNENNYGLTWRSFEIEALPKGEQQTVRARYLYSLFGEIIRDIKARDPLHPVAIANGDVQYLDLIAQECKGLDIFGSNVYRGRSARDLFQVVHDKLGIPVLFTEFGADAYDAKRNQEDDLTQSRYLLSQWEEIYEQSADKGRVGNAIGGLIFQWSDGWWKYLQNSNLDIHDTNASWANAAYAEDYQPGANNMNEEWWGLCAKGPPDSRGLYTLQPRTAYYALEQVLRLPPYAPGTTLATIRANFNDFDPSEVAFHYQADSALRSLQTLEFARLTGMRLSFETYDTGGARAATPATEISFDHMESMYADFEVKPTNRIVGDLSLNVLGNVAQNPIDQIFYENRGNPVTVTDSAGKLVTIQGIERVKIYKATVDWDDNWFELKGFYRTNHYHWGYEGDFFGLYHEANYGPSIDTYDADVPIGFELTGKRDLDGLKVAFGPQIWWGANPEVILKYRRAVGPVELTFMDEEQFATQTDITTSAFIPEQRTRKSTIGLETHLGLLGLQLGGIWAGSPKVGRPFLELGNGNVVQDQILWTDTLGGKLKLTLEKGRVHWYASSAYMGLVADGGPTSAVTFTGWSLKDSGSGDQVNALTGLALDLTPFQIAPNFLWQKPLVGPGPSISPNDALRNVLDDPFFVRANRQLVGAELLINYDPTPGTWLWAWDNDLQEDAPFAASLDLTYRHQPTSEDAAVGVLANGQLFVFQGAPPPRDLWDAQVRIVGHPSHDIRLVAHLFAGTGEPNGDSQRETHRYGGDARISWRSVVFGAYLKFNDWGPYDYYRDDNLTYPIQTMGDLAYTLGPVRWLGLQQTRVGVRGTLRYLNGFSPNFVSSPTDPNLWGREWEVRTYVVVTL